MNTYTGTHLTDYEMKSMGLSSTDFHEVRQRYELFGQIYPKQKIQITYSIPYLTNTERMSDRAVQAFTASSDMSVHHHGTVNTASATAIENSETISGIGDPVLITNYQVFNRLPEKKNGAAQRLLSGAGIVIPLGRYKTNTADPLERTHLPGSGSWRFMMNTTYLLKKGEWGMNSNISYLLSSVNKEAFSPGATFNASNTFYYQVHRNEVDLFPSVGLFFENANRSSHRSKELTSTGGSICFLHGGMDVYFKRLSVGTGFQKPVLQILNENQPKMDWRWIASLSLVI